jgi:hypothetical protein
MSDQETIEQAEGTETTEQRKLRLAKARLDNEAEEAAIVAEEEAHRDAAVKTMVARLDAHGLAVKAQIDADCNRIAAAVRPVVEAWNAAMDVPGAAGVLFFAFGYSEPGSGKVAHGAGGHSIQGVARKVTDIDVRHIQMAIEEMRLARYAEIDERVDNSKREAAQDYA